MICFAFSADGWSFFFGWQCGRMEHGISSELVL